MTQPAEKYLAQATTDIDSRIDDMEAGLHLVGQSPEHLDYEPFLLSESARRFLGYIINDADTLRNRLLTMDDAWHISQGVQKLRGTIRETPGHEGVDKHAEYADALAVLISPGGDNGAVRRLVFGTRPSATHNRLKNYASACASRIQEHFPGRTSLYLDDIMGLSDPQYQPSAEFLETDDTELGLVVRTSKVGGRALTILSSPFGIEAPEEVSFIYNAHQPGQDGLASFDPTDEQLAEWGFSPYEEAEPIRDSYCDQLDPEVFFPETITAVKLAKSICQRCVARSECLDMALEAGPDLYGVWGGLTKGERIKLLAKRAKAENQNT